MVFRQNVSRAYKHHILVFSNNADINQGILQYFNVHYRGDVVCACFVFDDLRPAAWRCLAKKDIPVLPDNLSSAAFL